MSAFSPILFLTIFSFFTMTYGLEQFVSPHGSCGLTCSGDSITPYDNLLIALINTQAEDDVTIYLLNDPSTPHYILSKEYTHTSNLTFLYDIPASLTLNLKKRVIQPLFCGEEPALSNPNLQSQCISRDEKLTVYVKTTEFTLNILQNMAIYNIVFDASEDIKLWNTNQNLLNDCIYNRKRCCEDPNNPSVALINCKKSGDYSRLGLAPSKSLFSLKSPNFTSIISFSLNNTDFTGFLSPNVISLINTGNNPFSIEFDNGAIANIYFSKGLIYHDQDSETFNLSRITVTNMQFVNYNPTDLLWVSPNRTEGYLLLADSYFYGNLTIKNSIFAQAATSLRDECPFLSETYFTIPMTYALFGDAQEPRSNLWYLFHVDHRRVQNSSSLIFFTSFDGALSITNSSFTRILGTSGSVLRIDDVTQPQTFFTITDSSFDDNFGYDGFSNIRISKVSGAAFVNMLSCPKINILGSNFTNAYGCPGSYGNVLLLCYWDDSPTRDGALSSYNILNDFSNLNDADDLNDLGGDLNDFDFTPTVSAYWKHRDQPEDCYITVKNCLFENNLASVSNSLAVIGSHFITLEGNIFQYNGGTTAEILLRRMSNSYFSSRYPDGFDSFFLIHFGQATTVYIDHFIRFYSISNQYRGNWGPWEGSFALGETLTLKNWIILSNTIVFNSDYFMDHQGIPGDIGQDLWDVSLKENYFRAPIMTLGYDDKGTQKVYSQIYGTLTRDVKIIMNGVTFYNNTAKYDYNSYTYNLWNLSPLFQENYVKQQRFASGFIKLLTVMESQDILLAGSVADTKRNTIGFLWQNANISKNQLLSTGCLFPTQWCESYFVMDTQIIENGIYLDAENFQVVQEQDHPNLQNIKSNTHGLFCLYTGDSLLNWANALFVMHNTTVRNNNGILINHATNNNVTSQIFYSHFENNTCLAASMITVFEQNQIFCLSSTFINNFNALGNIFAYKDTQYIGVQQTYLNNSGIHASLVYATESIRTIQIEVSARAYWNNINPEIPIFDSGTMAQGAPYFFDSVSVVIIQGDFRQNKAYSGLLNAIQAKIIVDLASINDNSIAGVSVIGNLMSISNIEMRNCEVMNNSISRHPDKYVSNIGIILLHTTKFRGENVNFINGTIDDGGVLMFGNSANVMLFDSSIQNYTKLDNDHNYLIWFTLTSANIVNLSCSNITNLLNLVSSDVNIIDLNIQNLQMSFGSQFIFQGFETSIRIRNLAYTGTGQTEAASALFQGDKNYFILVDSTITDATNTIFSMQTSKLFYLERNQFTFYQCPNQVTVADLSLTEKVAVISCVFSATGTVLTASNTLSQLTFINNIIITNSEVQTVLINTAKGVIFKQNSFINEGTTIPLNLAQYQVQILDSSGSISLTNNHFWSLKASISPFIIQSQKYPYNASLVDNTFVNNEASYGGSLQLSVTKGWLDSEIPQATIRNSVFLANKAIYSIANVQGSGRAGAFYLESSGSTIQSTLLEGTVFVRNRAEGAGGAIYFEYSPPVVDESCFFQENYASKLSHIESYPVQVVQYNEFTAYKVYIPNQNRMRVLELGGQNIWEGVGSGVTNQGPYKFALLDIYGQMISDDNTSELQIWPDGYDSKNRSDFAPKLSAVANNGIYMFQDFVFNYKIKEKINVKFVSDAIPNDPNNPYTNVANSISIEVNFRECKIGEYMLETQGSTKCIECQPGYWNLGGGGEFATSCIECDLESTVCLGGAKVGPRPGYWRLNEMATIMKECPNSNACLGNVVDGSNPITEIEPQGKCSEGFAGNLCNNCKDGWAKTSPTSNCINCQTNATQYLQLVGLIFLQMIFLAYNARKTMEIATQYFNNKGALELKNNAATLLRILTNYMQIIELVGDIPVTWPTLIKDSMTVSSKASSASTQAFSIDCFYLLIKGFTGIRLVYLKVLLVTMTPLIYIALGVIFWVLYFKVKKMSVIGNKDQVNKIVTTMVIICFNLQPNIIKSCFELFQCTNLYREDSPILYLTSDYDVQCWDSEHYKWAIGLGLPCLLFWGIGLPVGMFVVLRRNYRKLDDPEIVKKYVFLYLGYKQERFYWEFVIMLRKLALVCIAVFAGFHSINLQIYLVVVVIVWSQVLQRAAQPYNDKNLNHLERVALHSAGIVDFCGLYFQIVGDVVGLNTIMIIIGLVGNLYFIVEFVRLYFIYQAEQLKQNEKVMKIINLIGDKLCCCFKTKSAARAMKKVKSAVQKSKNGITRSLKFIVADEEISTLNALTECKGPSKNDLTIENNISDESHPVNCVKLPSSKTSRLNLNEKETIKEDIVKEHESEDENEYKYDEERLPAIEDSNDQTDRGEKLEPMNLASIMLDLDVNMTEIEKNEGS